MSRGTLRDCGRAGALVRWGWIALLIAAVVRLDAAPMAFDLPPGDTAGALLEFSKQAQVEVLFAFDELRAVRSPALHGQLEPVEALNALLRDTGFYARRSDHGKFIVSRLTQPTGAIRGRLVTRDGKPARGLVVGIAHSPFATSAGDNGEFSLTRVPPGSYDVQIRGDGYRPVEIVHVRVEPDRVVNLETNTMQPVEDVVHLAPQVVEGKYYRRWKARAMEDFDPQHAGGNLDLPRSEDDALPYVIFDRDQIKRSGVVNLNEFLQRNVLDSAAGMLPPEQMGGSDEGRNGGAALVASSTNLTLRGYKADETAILVDGRRLPEILTSGAQVQARPPDVNFIPLSLVERVEVLPVSSSALYSGNPVGGVINIVLRPDVSGTEVTTTYTNSAGRYDAPQSTVSLQHGETLLGGKLRLRLSATFTQATPPNDSELGYIQANVRASPLRLDDLHRATPNIASADGSPLFGPGTASFTSVAPGANGLGGAAALQARAGVRSLELYDTPGGMANSSDSRDYAYGRRQSGSNYFGSVVYDLTPALQLGFDGIYSRSVINRGYNVFAGNLTVAADSPLNPLPGRALAVQLNETTPLLGENFGEGRIDFYSGVLGALVKLPADWRVSLDGQYGHSITRYRGLAGVSNDRWQHLVDTGVYNPFRDTQKFGPPPEFYDHALIYYGQRNQFVVLGDYRTFDTALRVTNQSLPLPTGSGALNFGGDYRINQLANYTDYRRYGDGTFAATPVHFVGRQLERISVFGELQAPLVPAKHLPRWLREIEADLAARYVIAATAQERNVAPTAGLKADLAGGFSLRASVATSNRFPTPFMSRADGQATGPGGGDVDRTEIFDPRRGEKYKVLTENALNPNLRSEANITRTAGVMFQRGREQRFRAAVDFVETRKSGEQATLDANAVLALENSFPLRVIRDPAAPGDPGGVGRANTVFTGPVNLAWRESQQWTTSLDYAWRHCFGGELELYGHWSYYSRYDVQVRPGDPVVDELRNPDGAAAGVLKHRVNFGGSWTKRAYGFGIDGHYYHSRPLRLDEWVEQHRRQINPYWQFDAFVQNDLMSWLPWKSSRFGLKAQFRVNNILNARPPRYANDPSGAGVQTYTDWRTQTYAFTLEATF